MGMREKEQADFDLERFIDMFDEALTSKDERVVNALRSLMMMVILTKPEGRKDSIGPLRQVLDDQNNILRRLERMETEIRSINAMNTRYGAVSATEYNWHEQDKYTMLAAKTMAQSIDDEVMRKLASQINGGKIKGLK